MGDVVSVPTKASAVPPPPPTAVSADPPPTASTAATAGPPPTAENAVDQTAAPKSNQQEKSTVTTRIKNFILPTEPGGEDDENLPEDLEKQEAEKDFSGEYGKRVYCKRHFNSLYPLKIIFFLGGRFPFSSHRLPDGTYQYKFSLLHPLGLYSLLSTITMFITLIFGLSNIIHITLNISLTYFSRTRAYKEQREYEEVLIRRYYIPLILVYSSLMHGCIGSVLVLNKRHYIAHYLTFWSKAVYTMHMDVSRKARGYASKVLILFISSIVTITMLAVFRIGPSAIGLPTVFGTLTARLIISKERWLIENGAIRRLVQVWGGLTLILAFAASKSYILLFIYHCKTLQSAFAYWNGRVYAAVLRGGDFVQTEEGRTTYKLLFKDHCVLMDLMEGMDHVFSFIVESYFGSQIFSLFFELYFCIRTGKHGADRVGAAYPEESQSAYFVRPNDWAPGLLMLLLSVSLMFGAAKSAAHVAGEAMAGLEVIRRKTMLGRKTDDELYFMLSMFSSYTGYKRMEISAAGYYYMNKDFVIGLISSVLSYFIILYQFQPVMDVPYAATGPTRQDRIKFGKFLSEIEGLEDEHYETTTTKDDLFQAFRNP